ncbi:carbonic anhydrase Mig5 [Legionella birminghamensis]|uniref:Carbonic anhydrase Mig5 n=1 Tax=Legionella birminghamensis TaxID=28083 RepID=A0A378I6B6_9GAMM|nr:carbonic anhydrase family protein [Legionella birminghamensis]KTC73765.1 carbonic anhydrase Mig5 [Legionella birminghamensis]STX30738.1 carbonic anhydrase Mig5 [Legionella birminghamensis]
MSIIRCLLAAMSLAWMQSTVAASVEEVLLIEKISTAEKQQSLTPKQALMKLKEGNQRFLDGKMQQRNYRAQAKQSSYGQYPWAVVLNCMDSRSVPEIFFDQGLADLFILRVAGNVLSDDMLGSMEFASKVVGSRLIVVLGHTSCGAMAGACENVSLGHLDHILDKIKPVVAESKKQAGTESCTSPQLLNQIARNNALNVVRQIREQSPIIRDLLDKGQVGIVAGVHDIKTGKVTFFEEERMLGS